jgi:hypothetical protein
MAGVPRGRPSRAATPCPFCGQRLLSNRAVEQVKVTAHERARELAGLKRQLREAKRAQGLNPGEHGEFSEVDVSLRLIKAFPDDQITWTRPGRRGAEILQTVRFDTDGDLTVAGHVIYKCKDVQRWNAGFITQIKAAAKLAEAPYAILVSPRFPRNLKSVAVVDEVVIVDPANVVVLAGIIRRVVIESYRSGAIAGSRAEGLIKKRHVRVVPRDEALSGYTSARA